MLRAETLREDGGRKALVFDLDGTLVDTAPGIAREVNHLLAEHGRPGLDLAEVRRFIGDGVVRLAERCFAATGAPLGPEAAAVQGGALAARLEAAPPGPEDLYPGVAETLDRLAGDGWRLGVCTNKPHEAARVALRTTGLDRWVPVLRGGGSLPQRKPAPEPLWAVIEALGAAGAAFVGDSEVDGDTARNAGLPLVLVTYGYLRGPAAAVPAAARVNHFAELPGALERLMAA